MDMHPTALGSLFQNLAAYEVISCGDSLSFFFWQRTNVVGSFLRFNSFMISTITLLGIESRVHLLA